MTGWCVTCREPHRVRSTRGSRLSNHRCAKCGGELVGSAKYKRLTGEADARRPFS